MISLFGTVIDIAITMQLLVSIDKNLNFNVHVKDHTKKK